MKVFHIDQNQMGNLRVFWGVFFFGFFLEVMVCFYFCFFGFFEMVSYSVVLKLMMVLSHPKS